MSHPRTTREVLKASTFTITQVREERCPWSYGIIVRVDMPAGCFATLDPPVGELASDHCAVGLKSRITSPDGEQLNLQFDLAKCEVDGRIVLFFGGYTERDLPRGSTVRFMEA
jgi:hypothetical protein